MIVEAGSVADQVSPALSVDGLVEVVVGGQPVMHDHAAVAREDVDRLDRLPAPGVAAGQQRQPGRGDHVQPPRLG